MNKYVVQLTGIEKICLEYVKAFWQGRSGQEEAEDIDQYNKETDEAMAAVNRGILYKRRSC